MWAPGRERRRAREGGEKIADRPHKITILLSSLTALSVLTAIVTLLINYRTANDALATSRRAVEISERNLRVGQRAYVVIRNGRLALGYTENATVRAAGIRADVRIRFEVHNLRYSCQDD
jgi:hypothetical protein